MSRLRRIANLVRRLPIHPQWLLGARLPMPAIQRMRGTVLDVGCADRWVEPRCATDVHYIGLDYPPTGRTLYAASPDVYGDAGCLPFTSGSIDGLVCLEVLEHVRDHQAALREFARVLKPGGSLSISMPFMYPVHDAPYDFQRLTRYGLQRDLAQSGFDIIRMKKVGHSMHAAGLLACLSLVGWMNDKHHWYDYVLLPIAIVGVLFVNLSSVALGAILPDWDALGMGYTVEASRRSSYIPNTPNNDQPPLGTGKAPTT